MYSDTKTTRSVAEAVMKVMNEKLHPNQQKLDVHEPEKDELTAKDFEMLRAGKKAKEVKKEETEQEETILEYESKDGKFVHNAKAGRYGGSEKPTDPFAGVRGPGKKDIEKIEKEKKKKKPFSEMVNQYQQTGLKSLSEMFIKEEPTNDEYKKELDDVKAKASGAKTNPDIAKGKVDAVKNEEVEQIDEISKELATSYLNKREAQHKPNMNSPETSNRDAKVAKGIRGAVSRVHGYGPDKAAENKVTGRMAYRKSVGATHTFNKEEVEQIDEREMTDSEMKKREEIVKSMKKGMAGFKERYGDRAKNVMYATATKQAMKEETESEHYKAGHEYASDHAQDSGFKVTARARKKEMLADNPHKKGTQEHSDWHRGALDGHQTALDNM